MEFELPFFSLSAWSCLLLALAGSWLTLPLSYHPLPLYRLLIGEMASRVYDKNASPSYLVCASLLLCFLVTLSTLILAYGIVSFAQYPTAFELIILYFFIYNPYASTSLRRVTYLIKHQQKPAARELLAHYVRRDTANLSQQGLIKALIESQSLNYFRSFFLVLIFYYSLGFVFALTYVLFLQCSQVFSKSTPPNSTFSKATNSLCYALEYLPIRLFCLPLLLKPRTLGFRYLALYVKGSYHNNTVFLLACLAGFCNIQLGGPAMYSQQRFAKTKIGHQQQPQFSDINKTKKALLFASLFWFALLILMESIYAVSIYI